MAVRSPLSFAAQCHTCERWSSAVKWALPLQFGFGPRLPIILQTEAAECGLACLAMLLGFHGHHIDLGALRRRHSVSLKGATLRNLMTIAMTMGLSTRALKLEIDDLSRLH